MDVAKVREYCALELITLSKALTVLRDGFDKMGIKLKSWSGAGSAAGALILKEELRERHFSTVVEFGNNGKIVRLSDIKKDEPEKHQMAAHHAFFGGRMFC